MIRHATFTVDEIFQLMEPRTIKVLKGFKLKVSSDRIRLFKEKGLGCVSCGLEGSFFALESVGTETPHLNLYAGLPGDGEVLMTKDHIKPKSKGGANHMDNYQPMCSPCNGHKADKLS